jgi:hypothetical protein
MKPLHEQTWFTNTVNRLRQHSPWFERWGWGYSKDMADFVDNPFEELRDHHFPFCFTNVKPTSLLLRIGFVPFTEENESAYKQSFPFAANFKKHYDFPARVFAWGNNFWQSDIGWGPWKTKYPNATFMFQLILSFKWHVLPIPFIACNFRTNPRTYWQFGIGWGPQWKNYNNRFPGDTTINAVLCGKFRHATYSSEAAKNPGSEVYGYWEGDV